MKNILFYRVMPGVALAVCLVFAGCAMEAEEDEGLPSPKGKFTLTGASMADSQYAFILTALPSPSEDKLLGISDSNKDGSKLKGAQIKDGTVKIPLYVCDTAGKVKSYDGDHTGVNIKIYISTQKEMTQDEIVNAEKYITFTNVTFEGGKAEKSVEAAYNKKLD
ncbi:MAG: hypothetical protein LBG57_13410 [Treponema sp.]|nr:hypothetical protein [Treponema sp.]